MSVLTKIVVKKLLFQETGVFQDVYVRPLQLSLNDGADDMLRRRLHSAGEGRLTRSAFKGIGSRILAPSMNVRRSDIIQIPDGWDRPRCRWSMELAINNDLGHEETMFVQGYTDHMGLSPSGALDPRMKMYINGFIRVNYGRRDTAYGSEEVPRVVEVAQVVAGQLLFDRDVATHSTRPVDVYHNLQSRMWDTGSDEPLGDGRGMIDSPGTALFSRRSHTLAGDYLANTLQTYRNVSHFKDFGTDRTDILGMAQQDLSADIESMRDNPFIRQISNLQGVMESVTFTIRDLLDIDRDMENRRAVSGTRLDLSARRDLASLDNCSHWSDSTRQAQMAVQLSTGLSAIMMQWYHTGLGFQATNQFGPDITIVQNDAFPVADNLPESFNESMMDAVHDLLVDLSQNNQIVFDISVSANLYDQTRVEVGIGRDPMELFYVPSFADSILAPMYTRNTEAVEELINGFQSIIETSASELSGSSNAVSNIHRM